MPWYGRIVRGRGKRSIALGGAAPDHHQLRNGSAMAGVGASVWLRVFLASPGDVAEERAFAREYLETILPNDPLLQGRARFEVVKRDHPHAPTPMLAHLTPQEAVIRFKGRPAECDIVIVLLAARLGTHLALDTFRKPDGSGYLSGTEWEFDDAWSATPRPQILVYSRQDLTPPRSDDPQRDEKNRQDRPGAGVPRAIQECRRVLERRLPTCTTGSRDFRKKLESDVKHLVAEHLSKLPAPPSSDEDPPPGPPPVPLPERCFGRVLASARLAAVLCAGNVPSAVLVQGPGGIGKTTLTQDAANHPNVVARFGARRWFVALETATDRDTFDAAMLAAIGLDPTARFAAVTRRLAQAPTLLVLDNLETAWERAGPAIEARLGELAAVPGVALLASFRGQEAVGGVRWSLRQRVDPLPDDEARALFLDIAESIPADDPHLLDLLRELGGVPLAICLTARRAARHADLAGLWAEWQRVGVDLAQWQGVDPSRLTSVAHSIEVSLRSPRLPASAQRLFAMLGQLPAGLARLDRDTLMGAEAFAAEDGLIAVGLAMQRTGRLDLLPPVRRFACVRLAPDTTDAEHWCRHYLDLALLGTRIWFADGVGVVERLEPEWSNIEAAMRAALQEAMLPAAVAAIEGLYRLMATTGCGSLAVLRQLARACQAAGDTEGEAKSLWRLGDVAFFRSDYKSADADLHRALALFEKLGAQQSGSPQTGDKLGKASCLWRLGNVALARSDHAGAQRLYEQALPLFREIADLRGEAFCIQGSPTSRWSGASTTRPSRSMSRRRRSIGKSGPSWARPFACSTWAISRWNAASSPRHN